MENASKALIIAGAVLLSILIIAIGMSIYNGAQETVQGALSGMDEQAIQTHNQKFEAYQGTKKGSEIKSLISTIVAYNQSNVNNPERRVQITSIASASPVTTAVAATGFASATAPRTLVSTPIDATSNSTNALNALKGAIQTGSSYVVTLTYDNNTSLVVNVNISRI